MAAQLSKSSNTECSKSSIVLRQHAIHCFSSIPTKKCSILHGITENKILNYGYGCLVAIRSLTLRKVVDKCG